MSVRYAYLKTRNGESPFYVHLTLDGVKKSMRIYWHMSWWKNEDVDDTIFKNWLSTFKTFAKTMQRPKIKERKCSYRLLGRSHLSSEIMRDVVGIVCKDTLAIIPCKIEYYVNTENKLIEIVAEMKYSALGGLPDQLLQFTQIFTSNPDTETVRERLLFFDPTRVILESGLSSSVDRPVSPQHLPKHRGSPIMKQCDMKLDPTMDPNGHPFGLELKE